MIKHKQTEIEEGSHFLKGNAVKIKNQYVQGHIPSGGEGGGIDMFHP